MAKTFKKLFFVSVIIAMFVACFAFSASAASESNLTFTLNINEKSYSVTDCKTSAQGALVIPQTYHGMEVTSISGFSGCTGLTSITIPDSVTYIGSSAFSGCTGLTSITIPDSVTSIGWYAFEDCTGLTSITIGNGVTSIGKDAFYNCTALTSITLPFGWETYNGTRYTHLGYLFGASSCWDNNSYVPKSLKEVIITAPCPDYAFYGCTSLTSITISDGVTYIDPQAFKGCTGLTSITIPDSVTYIGSQAFEGCTSLKNVYASDVLSWLTINFQSTSANPLYYGANLYFNNKLVTELIIPDSVTSIRSDAFCGCTSLKSITIPDGVTSIGDDAFNGCTGLTSITIPDSVTSIGKGAFYNSGYYNNASNWTNKVLYIGNHLIKALDSITSYKIMQGTKYIGYSAFYGCTGLTSITIPDSVTSIRSDAFRGCTDLTSITIPDSVTSIGSDAFRGCTSLASVIIGNGVTSIGSYVFYNCTSLTSIAIPDSVTSIGSDAFYTCTSLASITIPDSVTEIGSDAFRGCKSLASITLPFVGASQNGTSNTHFGYIFGASSYSDNDSYVPKNLKEVIITAPCKTIGYYAFYGCKSLTSITIPDSVTSIDYSAFVGCTGLKNVYASDVLSWLTIDFQDIDANPLNNGANLYFNNKLVTELIIPDSVTSIDYSAFYGCTSLTSITIPDSVTSIGSSAFEGCTSLTRITIPDSVTSIGSSAFEGCTSLTSITLPFVGASLNGTSATHFGYIFGASICLNNDSYVPKNLKEVIITAPCKTIGSSAFESCTGLKSITIPDSVTSIGFEAFRGCTRLTSITIPDSVTSISSYAFYNCTSLASITIPDSVTSIGFEAFYNCTGLTSITIPDGVTSIGSYVFYNCTSLTSITIPDGVTSIGEYAFYNCTSLTSVIIGNGVTSIGSDAFRGCTGLTSITIPISLENIDANAFKSTKLNYVFYKGTEEQKNNITIAFDGNDRLIFDAIWHYQSTDHCYNITEVAPTCENKGIKTITCVANGCDFAIEEELPATGHSYDSYTTINNATCTSIGTKQRTCSICNNIETLTIAKLQHEYSSSYTIDTPATCTTEGSKSKHCTRNGCTAKTSVTVIAKLGHKYDNACDKECNICKATRSIKHTYTNACDTTCNICKATRSIKHSYKTTTTKATLKKNGSVVKKCTVCGIVASKTTIKYVKSIKLSATSYTYNGKVKTPTVTVKDSSGKTLKKNTDYTVSYAKGRKKVGTYKVTIKFKGNYSGTKTLTFKINPAKTNVSKLTAGKKSITVNITKKSTQVTGYQIQYSTSKKFTKAKTKTITSYKTTKYTLKGLSAKKTYYVRVRTYKTVGNVKYYSGWSTYKYVKTK